MFFKKKKKSIYPTDNNRYKENPMGAFFEIFILDVINQASQEQLDLIEKINLNEKLNIKADNWQDTIKIVLNLSDTIDIAIKDLWYQNSTIAKNKKTKYEPAQFAIDFVHNFYSENSKIDTWTDESLHAAKRRIMDYEEYNL
jgi:hypothetical protein